MTSIKPIEGRSIHQITSGQVIVDLNSVVKELVENALDAGATSIDVRFRNNGLDSIEVQDNGSGIAPEDYETIALKHYTSKLASYSDLTSLTTFGFRGEALSSLCALSHFHILTARDGEAPKGKNLEFETSGKLKEALVAACQKGTTISVESLFHNLPVRRKELEKNIKREYSKVLGLLHAYACISTDVRISVSNQMLKGKKVVAFSTKSNGTTKENIANIFGAKTLLGITQLNLELELQPTTSQVLRDLHQGNDDESRAIKIVGHISKPVFGEGRQTPDRQMFFVNSRPCSLPQIARAFNEVYKSFNVTQSPFIFADLKMNTNAYDVNVSPDKRTILLHDQSALLESIKQSLTAMFEAQDQTVPQSQLTSKKLPAFRPLNPVRQASTPSDKEDTPTPATRISCSRYDRSSPIRPGREETIQSSSLSIPPQTQIGGPQDLISKFVGRDLEERDEVEREKVLAAKRALARLNKDPEPAKDKLKPVNELTARADGASIVIDGDIANQLGDDLQSSILHPRNDQTVLAVSVDATATQVSEDPQSSMIPQALRDFNARLASQAAKRAAPAEPEEQPAEEPEIARVTTTPLRPASGVVPSAFDRMRPMRMPQETAMITIGSKTKTIDLGTPPSRKKMWVEVPSERRPPSSQFARFAAPGTQSTIASSDDDAAPQEAEDEEEVSEPDEQSPALKLTEVGAEALPDAEEVNDIPDEPEVVSSPEQPPSEDASDGDYLDEAGKKKKEEERVQGLIRQAERDAALPTEANVKRAAGLLKGSQPKNATVNLLQFLEVKVADILQRSTQLYAEMDEFAGQQHMEHQAADSQLSTQATAEERLSLTINKSDFAGMRIVGQFNLGFILAVRTPTADNTKKAQGDDLFIIDQHASDEIYNFHRLSDTTTLTAQPLVHPHPLELTAVEEETILTHQTTLTANGFTISLDESGDLPVGQRCNLLTLPTSKETTFTTRDLEELIALLTETTPAAGQIVRPSKVRKMLAMRACRSSIMVGKTLTRGKMRGVLKHMGEIDKPWNCPHGRPTMRHVTGLDAWSGWSEDTGLADDEDEEASGGQSWSRYLKNRRGGVAGTEPREDAKRVDAENEEDDDDDEVMANDDDNVVDDEDEEENADEDEG